MLDINDLTFIKMVEHGVPLEKLEARLRPRIGLKDRGEEVKAHDEYGNFSDEGFLGLHENLLEVVHADCLVVERCGTTHKEIAEALEGAITTGKLSNPKYIMRHEFITMGLQDCPWYCTSKFEAASSAIYIYDQDIPGEDISIMACLFYSRMTNVEGPLNKLKIRKAHEYRQRLKEGFAVVTELHPHLIEEHYFFEGQESPYRANPIVLIKALGL